MQHSAVPTASGSAGPTGGPTGGSAGGPTGTSGVSPRVVVASGHPVVSRGLAGVLTDAGVPVVAQELDAVGALDAVARLGPEVLVVSLDLPGAEPEGAVTRARERWPHLAIVALSHHSDDAAVLEALRSGASAHVAEDAQPEHIVAAVQQAAAAPGAFLSRRRAGQGHPTELTRRESQVLRLAATGLTVHGMAQRLYISDATVRSHLAGVYRKLGVSSRGQAVLMAERRGLLR